jgi:hypothetical protein
MSGQGPCSIDGNIGMPLQLTGEIQLADKEKLNAMLPNDLVFSFGSFRTKPTLLRDNGGISLPAGSSQSLTLRDANYSLISASICKPQHNNFSDNQQNIIAEIIFTFVNTRFSKELPYLFFLCFPLYKSVTGSSAPFLKGLLTNEPMTSQMSLLDLVTEAKTFIFYNSCIPMVSKVEAQIRNYSSCALVASHALPVIESDIKNNLTLLDYMLPSKFTMDSDTIVEFKIDNSKFTFIPSSIRRGTGGKTYRATIQTNASIFFTRFSKYTYNPSLLAKANAQACKTSQINTNQLKCYTIKPKSDVKGGVLLVDPKTGKRMDKLLEEGDPGSLKPKSQNIAAIIGGSLGGLIALVLFVFVAMWLRRKVMSPTAAFIPGVRKIIPEIWQELPTAVLPIVATTLAGPALAGPALAK